MLRLSVLMAVFFGVGCRLSEPLISVDADKAVTESFSLRRAYRISPGRVRWFVDGTDGTNNPVVYVGYDMGTHYSRSAMLRVIGGRIVEREEMRADGELIWVPDR